MPRPAKPPRDRNAKETRIQYILTKMRAMKFRRGYDHTDIVERFGVAYQTAKEDCAEASRIIRREINDPDSVAADVGLVFQQILWDALEDAKELRGTKEGLKARDQIINLGQKWCDITGASEPLKVENVTKVEITPAMAGSLMREKFGNVGPKGDKE